MTFNIDDKVFELQEIIGRGSVWVLNQPILDMQIGDSISSRFGAGEVTGIEKLMFGESLVGMALKVRKNK